MDLSSKLENTREDFIVLLETMLANGVISQKELNRYVKPYEDHFDPEYVRQELETWYQNLGIEMIIGRKFTLSICPFTHDELEKAANDQEIILCVPKGIHRQELGKLFKIDSWALHDPLVTSSVEKEDLWFRTSMSLQPNYIKRTGTEVKQLFEDEGKVPFSLERYLVFIARMKYLTIQTPDIQYWTWLPYRAYDRSGMLIAGFDRNGSFNVHGWMPQFSASFLGARYGYPPKQ